MNRILHFVLFAFVLALFPSFPSHAATVRVEVIQSQERYPAGNDYPLAFRLTIQKPWSIHGAEAGKEELIPTEILFEPGPGLSIEGIHFPAPEKLKFESVPDPVEVFSGEVIVRATLRVAEEAPVREETLRGKLSYQACSATLCLPPEEVPVQVRVSVAPPRTDSARINSEIFDQPKQDAIRELQRNNGTETALWLTLIGLFFGGLALNLTPCIYPLIPITVSFFTGRAERRTRAVIAHAALYMLGLATTNAVLGLSAALSGGMLGSVLQSPLVLLFVVLILIGLASSFFGFWELRIPPVLARLASRDYGGALGSLFMGLTLGIVAAPCIGPFILGLLTYVGQKGDPFFGFLCFFVLSLGLGLPLALLALFSGAVTRLPLSGDWMLWVRKFMGWVLMGMAAFMAGPLIPSATGKAALLSVVALAAAVHLGWLDPTGRQHRPFVVFKRIIGVALAVAALGYFFNAGYERERVRWVPFDPTLLTQASRESKPAMLDFYADWCGPCRALEKTAFSDPEVVKKSKDFLTLRVDLTTRSKETDRLLALYDIRGVPTIVFLDREGRERREMRIESLVGARAVLDRMKWFLKE